MGPTRNAVWTESDVLETIPVTGLKKLWSAEIQAGYSGPAVANGKVYLFDRVLDPKTKSPDNPYDDKTSVGGRERLLCFNSRSGELLWKYEYPCDYRVSHGLGPRCTPTVHESRVYILGTMGDFRCLNAATGEMLWQARLTKDQPCVTPHWGFCGHPLIYKQLVIVPANWQDGLVAAFDKDNGKLVWRSLKSSPEQVSYSPPTLMEVDGQALLMQFHAAGLSALDPATGRHHWTVPLKPTHHMAIMAPQVEGRKIFVAGMDAGVLIEVTSNLKPVELWRCDQRTQGLHPINMTPLIYQQTIFGVDQPGMLRAVDLQSGKRLWHSFLPVVDEQHDEKFRGLNSATAFLVRNKDCFYSFNERGALRIFKLSSSGLEERGRADLIEPTSVSMGRRVVWSHPAFANKCVYVRNDHVLACFSLSK